MGDNNKTDWSRTAGARPAQNASGNDPRSPIQEGKLVSTGKAGNSNVPAEIAVNLPAVEQPADILSRWKTNNLTRKATLQMLEVAYNGRLEALKIRLSKALEVEKTQVAQRADEYLKKLDAEHLKVLAELGLQNVDVRGNVLIELNNMVASKLKIVQNADWPQEMIDETINNLFEIKKKAIAKILQEMGDQK